MQDTTDAKEKLGADAARRLAAAASEVIVARGNKVVRFDMKDDPPNDDTILAHMLGPTGNLRAPTIRKGKTVLVGFHEDVYREVF